MGGEVGREPQKSFREILAGFTGQRGEKSLPEGGRLIVKKEWIQTAVANEPKGQKTKDLVKKREHRV